MAKFGHNLALRISFFDRMPVCISLDFLADCVGNPLLIKKKKIEKTNSYTSCIVSELSIKSQEFEADYDLTNSMFNVIF